VAAQKHVDARVQQGVGRLAEVVEHTVARPSSAQPSPRCRPQPSWRSLKDVAAADGWQDTETLLKCYQQPDNQALPRRPAAIWSSTDNLDFNQDPNIARPISKNSRRHLPSTRRS